MVTAIEKHKHFMQKEIDWKMCSQGTLYEFLGEQNQQCFQEIHQRYGLTYQELRELAENARDLEMWGKSFMREWNGIEQTIDPVLLSRQRKMKLITAMRQRMRALRVQPRNYAVQEPVPDRCGSKPPEVTWQKSPEVIWGKCPASMPALLCCGLTTLETAANCAFECSYCAVKPFYGNQMAIYSELRERLARMEVDPGRYYHIGTGQSSDSLAWGNAGGILADLCRWAENHPNVLLELKTKSSQVDFVLKNKVPPNVICSWSLNTQKVIEHEERRTASLAERLAAALEITQKGRKVGFHFHPLVDYEGGAADCRAVADQIQKEFKPEQIAFISFGTLVFGKPTLRQIREHGGTEKILQMETEIGPHGKVTYPEKTREILFRGMVEAFKDWRGKVFMYLCMEDSNMWKRVFGWSYADSSDFERDFFLKAGTKVGLRSNGDGVLK